MFFTLEDYKKIYEWISRNSIRDTEFNEALTPLDETDTITLVLNGANVRVSLKDLIDQLFLMGVSDFLNITDKFGEKNITLALAIELIPYKSRKVGQVITFLDNNNKWKIYLFKGELTQWDLLNLWEDILDIEAHTINSILPDEEDLTKTLPDDKGNSYLSLKDREYNPEDFSGLGRIILRKNIVEIEDPIYGKVKKNILYQDMFTQSNTIYEIRYDFDLNGQEITIPKDSTLLYNGGSLNNGEIVYNNTSIEGQEKINNITSKGDYLSRGKGDSIYDPTNFSGLGRKYLQKNIINGKNILTQDMIDKENTIYIIQYDFTLGEDITVPANCILEFDGGSINADESNNTITGNNTSIQAGLENIFKTTKLNGTWNIEKACVKWFGIEGINTKDYTDDFYRVMDFLYYNNGGTLFIPKGYYTVNNTIGIPANTTIEGEGKDSVIYFTGENPWLGVALSPTGDNIVIKNLTVNYAEDDITCFKNGAQLGSIGIGTLNYVPNVSIEHYVQGNVSHITLENIYSINTAPLQTEPGELPYTVEDIKYINCVCPNGKIRCSPTVNSKIYGMLIEGCNCKEIGIGYGARTLKSAIINNCICNSLVLSDDNIIVSNTVVKAIGVYDYNENKILRDYAVFVSSNNLYFNNVIILNENVNVTKGIYATEHYHSTNVIFNSVYISGFTNSFLNPNGWEFVYSNCKFINSNGSFLSLSGVAFGCDISTSHYGGIRLLDKTYNVPVTLATGVEASTVLPQYITVTGVNVHIQACFSIPNGDLGGGLELFTISEQWRPSEDRYIKADYIILETDIQKPITLKVASATGIVSVYDIYTTDISPNTNLRIIIDGFYCIK